jgi:hypothetical protein
MALFSTDAYGGRPIANFNVSPYQTAQHLYAIQAAQNSAQPYAVPAGPLPGPNGRGWQVQEGIPGTEISADICRKIGIPVGSLWGDPPAPPYAERSAQTPATPSTTRQGTAKSRFNNLCPKEFDYCDCSFSGAVHEAITDTTHHEDGRIVDHITRKHHTVVPTTQMQTVEHTEMVTHMVNEVSIY